MKIFTNRPELAPISKRKAVNGRGTAQETEGTFSQALEQASSTARTKSTEPLDPTYGPQISALTPLQSEALAFGEETLELLEHYGNMLSDPDLGDSALESVSASLSEHAQDLRSLRDDLDEQDGLREMLNALGVLAVVESTKINRGDYSP
jgi:hypothetical protein